VLGVAFATSVHAEPLYDFEWRSFARIARSEGEQLAGEQRGRGTATLVPLGAGMVRLEFHGLDGDGSGVIGSAGPERFTFPTPISADLPPAPAHLVGGTFEPYGDPGDPEAFRVRYIEGFIGHATPQMCREISAWEREFSGSGVRIDAATPRQ
jgi:hypothetical protein